MRYVVLLFCLLSIFGASSCSVFSIFQQREEFVRVRNAHLELSEKPYYFAGANMWYGCYLGSPGKTGDRPRLLRELDSLKANGIINLRILAASEGSYMPRSVKPAIQFRAGVVDDTLLQGLDFILAEMAKRRMRAVLYLNNYWEWSGGMVAYNVWTGKDPVDPEDTAKGWPAFMDFSADFYSNVPANRIFHEYVRKLVSRKNSMNGRVYSEDPTIMAWQLANEPRPGTVGPHGEKNLPAFNRWIDETALFIHALDTNHLVSSGSEGTVGSLLSAKNYLGAHKTKYVDYLTMHLWPYNWGWFDVKQSRKTIQETEKNAVEYIGRHLDLARQLNKPIVLEEFGLPRDSARILPGTETSVRDGYYRLIVRMLYDSARAGAPIAGYNFWAWGGEGRAAHADGMWAPGDSFVGDPPQEPQGFNSTFVSDTSTLRVLRENAAMMNRLGRLDTLLVKVTR